jgi:transposase
MDRQYVGIDLHRRRSVIVRKSAAGEKLGSVRVANDALGIASALAEAGPNPEVVIEATYGWYWAVDLLQDAGFRVHLANPSGLNCGTRRVKNDERDAVDLIDMLRLGRLPEAWIAPPATRELRELVRYRAKLVALRSGLKAQVHAVMAKAGVLPAVTDMFCQAGNAQLDTPGAVLAGAVGRIGKDDARGGLASHAELNASVLEVPTLRAHRLCNQGDHGATERALSRSGGVPSVSASGLSDDLDAVGRDDDEQLAPVVGTDGESRRHRGRLGCEVLDGFDGALRARPHCVASEGHVEDYDAVAGDEGSQGVRLPSYSVGHVRPDDETPTASAVPTFPPTTCEASRLARCRSQRRSSARVSLETGGA